MGALRLQVFDGVKTEVREYESNLSETQLQFRHYTVGLAESEAVGAYVRVCAEPHAFLPYAYFYFKGLAYYTHEQSFSTGLRRFMELLTLAETVARVQALVEPQCTIERT